MTVGEFWDKHDVKVLGTIVTICSACNGGDAYLTQYLTMAQHALISLVALISGTFTINAGFKKRNGS